MSQQSQENQTSNITCKYCQSEAVIKYGKSKGTQFYYCKTCKRKFSNPNNIPKMQSSIKVIADSLNMHYEGMSLNEIRRYFIQQDGSFTSKVTPYNWEKRFVAIAEKEVEKYHPQVGEQWQAYETDFHTKLGGKKQRLWQIDVLDIKTRFLLASKLSYNRNQNDIRIVVERSKVVAGKTPEKIFTDGWKGYIGVIEAIFGGDTQHAIRKTFANKNESTSLEEWWWGTFKKRAKVMRGLKTFDSMNEFLTGWVIHYNYFRPYLSQNDKTTAQEAKIDFPFANWKELIEKQPYSVTSRIPINKPIKIIKPKTSHKLSPTKPYKNRPNITLPHH